MPRKPCTTSVTSSNTVPKTAAVVTKQLPRTPDAASLIQSARRRLQYSQLPVRCATKTRLTQLQQQQDRQRRGKLVNSLSRFTPKRCESAKNCCRVGNAGLCRKSLSMIDLNLVADQEDRNLGAVDLRPEPGFTSARLGDGGDLVKPNRRCLNLANWMSDQEIRESRAASLVCRALAVNAWRKKRTQVVELESTVSDLGQQLDHLQMQIVVLRKLLDKENTRVSGLGAELHKTKAQLEEAIKDRDQFKSDKEAADAEAQKQRDISDERQVSVGNLKNDLKSARDQLEAVDSQMTRDREKLLKLREDKKILLDKLSSCESLASERASQAEKAELALEDTHVQLDTQIALTKSLQEEVFRYVNLLKEKDDENKTLKERLVNTEDSEKALRFQNQNLESQIISKESKLKEIESAYEAKVMELNELQNRFLRQSQDSGWSSRVLQLAGSVVRAPRVIFRTLSFFSRGAPIL